MNITTRRILSTAAATGIVALATALPASAKPVWVEPAAPTPGWQPPEIIEVLVDDNAWEYGQIGLGALAGATAAGAAALALRRREHGLPYPA